VKSSIRSLLVGLVASCALVPTGVASAVSHPLLIASNLDSYIGDQELIFVVPTNDAAVAEATVYVGPGTTLTTQPGTTFGEAYADLISNAVYGNSTFELDGLVTSVNPTAYENNTCAPGLHTAVWLARMTPLFLNVNIDVPIYVDAARADQQSYASYVLKLCFPSPYIPYPDGAVFGARVLDFQLYLTNFEHAGDGRWTTVVTPFKAGAGPDPQQAAEAQAVVTQGSISSLSVLLKSKRHGKHKRYFARIHGRVTTTDGRGIRSQIDVYQLLGEDVGPEVASLKTDDSGAFHLKVRQKRTASYGVVAAQLGNQIKPAVCNPVLDIGFGPLSCASLTSSDFQSARVTKKVRIPKGGAGIARSRALTILRRHLLGRAPGTLSP
jgi:hypothetical protein